MLFYYSTNPKSVEKIKKRGCLDEVKLRSIANLDYDTEDMTLVVNPLELSIENKDWYGKKHLKAAKIPVSSIKNIDPYKKPRLVIAGGGFLTRQNGSGKEIALIYRRGKWDIPKGKLDPGESFKECAVREVQEELGIDHIKCVQSLGSTWHCYERKGKFCIKRTYWYQMETKAKNFHPQAEEDIEEAGWFPWSKAKEILGFPVFIMHMEHVEPLIMK